MAKKTYLYIRLPEDAWYLLRDTLYADAESSMLEPRDQRDLSKALAQVETIENQGEVKALDDAREVKQ